MISLMKKLTGKSFLKLLKEYLVLAVGSILNAICMYSFINPAKLIAGGFSGLASTLMYIFKGIIPISPDNLMSIFYFVLNVPLLICSLIFLRGDFTFKTIWTTIVCSGALALLPMINFPTFTDDNAKLIAVAFGGIMIGLAMYLAAINNGSNGGTEIIAKIVAKYHPEVDLSNVVLIANLLIAAGGSVVVMLTENEGLSTIIYSYMYIFMGSTVFGMFNRGFDHPQKFMIITAEYEALASDIVNKFKRGCTFIDTKSTMPDQPERKIIVVVVQHRQAQALKQMIKARDPNAFTIVKDVYDVFSRPTFNRSYKTK